MLFCLAKSPNTAKKIKETEIHKSCQLCYQLCFLSIYQLTVSAQDLPDQTGFWRRCQSKSYHEYVHFLSRLCFPNHIFDITARTCPFDPNVCRCCRISNKPILASKYIFRTLHKTFPNNQVTYFVKCLEQLKDKCRVPLHSSNKWFILILESEQDYFFAFLLCIWPVYFLLSSTSSLYSLD